MITKKKTFDFLQLFFSSEKKHHHDSQKEDSDQKNLEKLEIFFEQNVFWFWKGVVIQEIIPFWPVGVLQ